MGLPSGQLLEKGCLARGSQQLCAALRQCGGIARGEPGLSGPARTVCGSSCQLGLAGLPAGPEGVCGQGGQTPPRLRHVPFLNPCGHLALVWVLRAWWSQGRAERGLGDLCRGDASGRQGGRLLCTLPGPGSPCAVPLHPGCPPSLLLSRCSLLWPQATSGTQPHLCLRAPVSSSVAHVWYWCPPQRGHHISDNSSILWPSKPCKRTLPALHLQSLSLSNK